MFILKSMLWGVKHFLYVTGNPTSHFMTFEMPAFWKFQLSQNFTVHKISLEIVFLIFVLAVACAVVCLVLRLVCIVCAVLAVVCAIACVVFTILVKIVFRHVHSSWLFLVTSLVCRFFSNLCITPFCILKKEIGKMSHFFRANAWPFSNNQV